MKTEEIKTAANALNELNESYADFLQTMKNTTREVKTAKHLWRDQNRSKLIKLGLALIVFPEPTPISETIGACLVAAGTVQQGIRRRTLYADDISKTFRDIIKDVWLTRESL